MAHRALLVGIDEYQSHPGLKGCVNDVVLVRDVLKTHLGFDNTQIRVIVNHRATKGAILYRLEALIGSAEPGDILFFYFAGHGSQIRDRGVRDELVDHLDEIICPYDFDWDSRTFIVDDELEELFSEVPEDVLIEVFLDSCFWGAGTRDSLAPSLGQDFARVRFLAPPVDLAARAEGDEERLDVHYFTEQLLAENRVLWAASREGETSAEVELEGRVNGVFTYYGSQLVVSEIDAIVSGAYRRDALLADLRTLLAEAGHSQVPQLSTSEYLLTSSLFGPTE